MTKSNGQRWQTLGGIIIVAVTVISYFGLNGAVGALESRVNDLEEVSEQIEEIQSQVEVLRAEAIEIARFRNDILAAVCAANARTSSELRDCYRAVNSTPADRMLR